MTENLPRGNFGPIPSSLPAVSWFEFLLDEELLEKHLQKDNPGMYSINKNVVYTYKPKIETYDLNMSIL